MSAQSIEVDGVRIAYHRSGSGAPMLLVHGITTYSFLWREMAPELAKSHDVINVDLIGCGDSAKPVDVDYSIAAQATMLIKLMDALGVGEFHLVTHDIGCGIGQIMAVRNPGCIMSLVLMNPIGYDYWPVQPILTMRVPILRQIAMAAMDLGLLRALVKLGVYHKQRVTDELMGMFWKPLRDRYGRDGFLRLAKALDNAQLMEIAEALRGLPMPVLILRGEADPFLGSVITERLAAEIPGARLVKIPTAGHFLQVDEPELVTKIVLDFCAEASPASATGERKGNGAI